MGLEFATRRGVNADAVEPRIPGAVGGRHGGSVDEPVGRRLAVVGVAGALLASVHPARTN